MHGKHSINVNSPYQYLWLVFISTFMHFPVSNPALFDLLHYVPVPGGWRQRQRLRHCPQVAGSIE